MEKRKKNKKKKKKRKKNASSHVMVSPFKKAQKHPDSLLRNKNNINFKREREREIGFF